MPPSLSDDIAEQLHSEFDRLLVQRTRTGLALVFAGILLFAAVDLLAGSHPLASLYAIKVIGLAAVGIAYAAAGWPACTRHATVLAWLLVTATCAAVALSGILSGETAGSRILCISAALFSATLFPWSAGPQLAAAASAGTAIAASLYWAHGGLPPAAYPGIAATLTALAISVVVSHELQQHRLALVRENIERRRAEEQVTTLNETLERRVRERTAELEAATRKLEDEGAERLRAAEALRASQKQLQDIVDNSTAVIYLKDIQGRYLLVNSRYETLFHVSRAAVVGKTDYDFFPAEAAAAFQANDRQVLDANQPLHFEEIVPHDDGLRNYISVKFPLHDTAGVIYGICGISTDITPRKQMEAELRRSESTLSAVIESSSDSIWSIDRTYRLVTANLMARQLMRESFGRELTLGVSFGQPVPDQVNLYWRGLYDRALAGERVTVEQESTVNGTPRHFLISLNPVAERNTVTGLTVFAKDITALKQAEERARQHQAELAHVLRLSTMGEIVAGLAHEINQPLAAISNYARGCQRRIQSGDVTFADLGQAANEIAGEALRAGEILRRLRGLLRKDSPRHEAFDVNPVVSEAVRVMGSEANLRGTTIRLATTPQLPQVKGDIIQIEQVMVNLLLNAIEALESVPSDERDLTVRTALLDGVAIEVSVHDTGVGLAPEIGDKVFDPFFTTKLDGLGMGLAISRSIIEAHNGRLWVTCNPDRGSTFHFTLPLA
jgi:PAS domain S-box-containing protein